MCIGLCAKIKKAKILIHNGEYDIEPNANEAHMTENLLCRIGKITLFYLFEN